jgi:Flp pilus assembly protein TadD
MKRLKMNPTASNPELIAATRFAGDEEAFNQHFGETTLSQVMDLNPDALNAAANYAANLTARGAFGEAIEIFATLALIDPMNVEVQVGLATCANGLGEHDLAIQAAAMIITLAPSDPRGYMLSGKNCLMIGLYEEAREDLTDARQRAGADAATAKEAEVLLAHLDTLSKGEGKE